MWIVGLSVAATALLSFVGLWAVIGFILWRNSKATCPECGCDPIKGRVGWTRESIILWALLVACIILSSWFTFWIAKGLIWIFTPVPG